MTRQHIQAHNTIPALQLTLCVDGTLRASSAAAPCTASAPAAKSMAAPAWARVVKGLSNSRTRSTDLSDLIRTIEGSHTRPPLGSGIGEG